MLTALLVLFVLMGSFAGYWSATMYKFFNGKMWKRCTLATALLFPSMIFAIFWALDIMVGHAKPLVRSAASVSRVPPLYGIQRDYCSKDEQEEIAVTIPPPYIRGVRVENW